MSVNGCEIEKADAFVTFETPTSIRVVVAYEHIISKRLKRKIKETIVPWDRPNQDLNLQLLDHEQTYFTLLSSSIPLKHRRPS